MNILLPTLIKGWTIVLFFVLPVQAQYTFQWQLGSESNNSTLLNFPADVSLDAEGNIYVADAHSHRIQKFASDGTFISKFGSKGFGDGQFDNPLGVAVDAIGSIYVADRVNHRIQIFAFDGTFLSKFGSYGSENGQFKSPSGVVVDKVGNIYVADTENHRIQIFAFDGTFLSKFGSYGSEDGQFGYPIKVSLDVEGNVYVADGKNHRIQKFTADGTFLFKYGSYSGSPEDGELYNPQGIAVDVEGNVYVADAYKHRIQKFASDGSFLSKFGSLGTVEGQFSHPMGVTVDREGNIYVADSYNNRIQKFNEDTSFLWQAGVPVSNGQFSYPFGVATDATGNIYVVDTRQELLQKFSANGTFLSKFGSKGSGDEQFDNPCGVSVDREGNIYVADAHNHRIQKFATDGSFIEKIGSYGSANGEFYYPYGIAVDAEGNVLVADTYNMRIQKFSPYSRAILLYADSVAGYPEEEIEVQVRANDFVDIISAQATLEWDPEVAELLSVKVVSLAQVQFNTKTSDQGKMTFSWYESSNVDGLSIADSTVLFSLRFRLTGKPKEQTALSFTSSLTPLEVADKEEKTVKVNTQAGKLFILPLQTISGSILTEASQAVKDVEVKLTGYAADTDSTDTEGKYKLAGVHPYKSYSITASKEQHDASFANGLTSLDLAILQRHILQTETLSSPYKLIAADVDLSETITTADIRDIQDVVLGNTDRLAKGKHWTFIPKNFVFADPAHPYPFDTALVHESMPALTGHDFVAINLGDVNDTWDPAKGRLQQKQLRFFVEQHETFSSNTITVPIKVADFKDVSSFQLTLEWDEKILAFESAQGDALPDVIFGEKYTKEGQLTVLWYNRQGSSSSLSDKQAIFTVIFKTVGTTGAQSAISVSSARTPLLAYDAANVAMDVEATAGIIDLVEVLSAEEDPTRPTVYKLFQNEPNPFTEEVKFRFALPQQSRVNLKVMNDIGQVFYQTTDTYEQGTHTLSWDGRNAQAVALKPGVYFLQLTAGPFQQIIKIIKK